jgi:hypothetical protein
MDLNLITFGYLFFRLAPFILVCFFTLASFFNQDFKGLVYLIGLIFACFSTMMIGNSLPIVQPENTNELCNIITIGGTPDYSKLPLGQSIFGYTFAYLMFIILNNKLVLQNLPTIIFFPIIISSDILWNMTNNCYTLVQLLVSLTIGGLIGLLWAYVINKTKMTQFQYFNQISGKQACTRPSKSTFKCNVYKNGNLISGTTV